MFCLFLDSWSTGHILPTDCTNVSTIAWQPVELSAIKEGLDKWTSAHLRRQQCYD